jgi:outer membrane lipoprotein-sorting protein
MRAPLRKHALGYQYSKKMPGGIKVAFLGVRRRKTKKMPGEGGNMKKFFWLFLLWSVLSGLTVDELLRDVADNRARIQSYQTEVETTVESAFSGRRTQRGRAYYQAPDLLRTDTLNPRQTVLNLAGRSYIIAQGRAEELKNEDALAALRRPENLLEKFAFTLEPSGSGWRLTGSPRSAGEDDLFSSVYFSRLLLDIDAGKNISGLFLYDPLAKEVLRLNITYAAISGLAFPVRTEITLAAAGIKVLSEHKQVKLNAPLNPELFDPQKISEEE